MSKVIIGVDEVGCGALAGPLVVAAVAFATPEDRVTTTLRGVRGDKVLVVGDSKGIKDETHRALLAEAVEAKALASCVIERSSKEIDARLLSVVFPETVGLVIARVVEELRHREICVEPADFSVLIDGDIRVPPSVTIPFQTIPDGDKKVWQIGAASILAKVKRDARMAELHKKYPVYGFDKHKGYPVPAHKRALKEHGICAVHRKSFRPVAEINGLPEGFEV